jgi:CO/xanthine dehydrogenase FAD-binding subunit
VDLNTVREIIFPDLHDGGIEWREGDAWLAGGTWLFSEPQLHMRRLIDLRAFGWAPLTITDQGLEIAATCEVVKLDALKTPPEWTAGPLIRQCCRSLLASFKIWNTATVGGNICMSLPAGALISLATALEGVCTIVARNGSQRQLPIEDFVTGNHQNVLRNGDLLRRIDLPATALQKRAAFRRMSLTHLGRSAALLIGTLCPRESVFMLTVTAATSRPLRLSFSGLPDGNELRSRLEHEVPDPLWFDDVHGSWEYKRHLTFHYAEEIRRELAGEARS